jgi:AcrR family transcriptional regulator
MTRGAEESGPDTQLSDQRLLRGARSRQAIVRRAVDMASLDGLSGISLGRIATDLGISKSGVQTLFVTKENLQIAAAESAGAAFHEAVVRPALAAPAGAARLRALVEGWLEYAEAPLFPGGCFWAANLPDFDSHPGPVRDVLAAQQRGWRQLIARELRNAADAADGEGGGGIADLDADLAAFQIDAVLLAANTALRLGEPDIAAKVRRVVENILAPLKC